MFLCMIMLVILVLFVMVRFFGYVFNCVNNYFLYLFLVSNVINVFKYVEGLIEKLDFG